ncbi:short-chain dehydrogenase protein [Rutstroemia sp. NJR-2017a BVV2]|nr:short-chain dehydrogenase protein [Rutstroemia sp. NJR-2017a BVV2]
MSPAGSILVTGANGGIGSAIISRINSTPELASYHGIYTVRHRAAEPLPGIMQSKSTHVEHHYEALSLDLSRLENVREIAAIINRKVSAGEIPPIRALILNAGYQEMDEQRFTDDGLATVFVANYLGHWLLVLLLLGSMDRERGRIVVLGSKAHEYGPVSQSFMSIILGPSLKQNARPFADEKWKTILADSTDPIAKGTWSTQKEDPSWMSGMRRYGAAKLCAIMMIAELQRRLDLDANLKNISILGIDPGTVPWYCTHEYRASQSLVHPCSAVPDRPPAMQAWHNPKGNNEVQTVDRAAKDILAAAFDSSSVLGEQPKGLYLDGSERAEISAEAQDPRKREMA